VALVERIGRVDRGRVFGVVGTECPVDPAARPRSVCIAVAALTQHEHVVDATLGEFDGGSSAGCAGTDDEHGDIRALVFYRLARGFSR